MRNSRFGILLVVVALLWTAPHASLQTHSSTRDAFSPDRAAVIDRGLQRYIDDNKVAGIVALVLQDGQPVYEKAFGWADKEAGRKMTTDTLVPHRVADQGADQCRRDAVDRRRQARHEHTREHLHPDVHEDHRGRAGRARARSRWCRPSGRSRFAICSRTPPGFHTAPIRSWPELYEAKGLGPAAGMGWYTADKDEPVCTTMERLGTLPFVAQPGEQWVYGYNTDILGCMVEKASGMPLDQYIRTHITGPLGMKDTQFFPPAGERTRLSAVYGSGEGGSYLRAPDGAKGQGHYIDGPHKNFAGGAGLISTARDYARFLEAMRQGGTLDGVRLLSPRGVKLMTTNQVGTLHSTTGLGWGLGFETVDRYGANGMSSEGAFGWGGAYGSVYRVDPEARLVMVLMIQLIPNATDVREVFPNLVYQALK